MTGLTLRDYQRALIQDVSAALKTHPRVILQAPTGSGKSVMIAHIIGTALERGFTSWLICHRRELLDQLSDTLTTAGVPHGQIMAGRRMSADPVQVCSIQTLVRRVEKLRPPRLLAIDECHHAVASTYKKVIDYCNESLVVGLTATPARGDGRGLGDVFGKIVPGPSVATLTAAGHLAPFRIIAPAKAIDTAGLHIRGGDFAKGELEGLMNRTGITGDAVEQYKRLVAPGTCLVYCVSRLHAKTVTAAYRDAGIDAHYVCGDTPKDVREETIKSFRNGHPPVIVSVDLFGEGLDAPGLKSVQLLRPTQSLGLHLQQVGRGLRPEPGKDSCIILDHVGNTWRHGLPDDARVWLLDPKKKRSTGEAAEALRHCPECFSVFSASLTECPDCGHHYEVKGRVPDEQEGELHEIEADRHRKMRKHEEGQAGSDGIVALCDLAIERGYKFGWAARRYTFRNRGVTIKVAFEMEKLARREIELRP